MSVRYLPPAYSPVSAGSFAGGLRGLAFGGPAGIDQWLARRYNVDAVLLVDSGTSALRLAIESTAAEASARPRVALPAYGCYDLATAAIGAGSEVAFYDLDPLTRTLREICQRGDVNLIVTTGGTGLGPRDNTPEATLKVIDREAPGMAEAIRAESLKVTPMAMISRGVCGVCGGTLIVNLPGSPKAVKESFAVVKPVLGHAADLLAGKTGH